METKKKKRLTFHSFFPGRVECAALRRENPKKKKKKTCPGSDPVDNKNSKKLSIFLFFFPGNENGKNVRK